MIQSFNTTMAPKKSARATILEMEIGQTVEFPLTRYDYIVNCKTRLQIGTTQKWASEIDRINQVVKIKRTN